MSLLGPGRIFWAIYPGNRGDGKKRPMITISRRADINRTAKVFAVVCSTEFDPPLRQIESCVPHTSDGQGPTKLKKATVAVCDWTTTLPLDAIDPDDVGGMISAALLREICWKAQIPFVSERSPIAPRSEVAGASPCAENAIPNVSGWTRPLRAA